jgi:hypothetical protein
MLYTNKSASVTGSVVFIGVVSRWAQVSVTVSVVSISAVNR